MRQFAIPWAFAMGFVLLAGLRADPARAQAVGVEELLPAQAGNEEIASEERKKAETEALAYHKKLVVRTWSLCQYERDLDCQWQGIVAASDGNCYFASSTHSRRHGAVVFRYDPRAETLTRLCDDITTICGENPRAQVPQGIMPTVPAEIDGWIYWGTHCAFSGPEAALLYTGAHGVGYNLKNGEWRDLGVLRKGFTIWSGLAGDPKRKRLFATVSPTAGTTAEASHLYRIDLPEGRIRDAGVIAYGGPIGYPCLWVDSQGRCWVSAPAGTLLCYDPERDVMQGWLDMLPPVRTPEGYPDPDYTNQAGRMWDWVRGLPGQNRCLFTLRGGAGFHVFSPALIGRGPGAPFTALPQLVGYTGLACALTDDRIYFVQEVALARAPRVGLLHLKSLDTTRPRAEVVDHGAIVDKGGRLALRIAALAADGKGHIYMVGDWRTAGGQDSTLLYQGEGTYKAIERGQFFATVTLAPE